MKTRRLAQRRTLDLWATALARGDADEVDRIVQQSRIDRTWVVASEQVGTSSGEFDPLAVPVREPTDGPLLHAGLGTRPTIGSGSESAGSTGPDRGGTAGGRSFAQDGVTTADGLRS